MADVSGTATDGLDDLVGLRDGFDQTWRGYDPRQVDRFLDHLDTEMDTLINDRDAAYRRCHDAELRLAVLRAENDRLREVIDSVTRTPIDREGLDIRLTRMVELAEAQVAEAALSAADIRDNHRRADEAHTARLREQEDQVRAACERIERDFTIALRSRRAEAAREIDALLAEAAADREAAAEELAAATALRAAADLAAATAPRSATERAEAKRPPLAVIIPEQRDGTLVETG